MKNIGHTEAIQKGVFLLIGSGESYNTEIVRGPDLVEKILEMTCGLPKDASREEREQWTSDIDDPDNWRNDIDWGPIHFAQDVGKTDKIEIFLVTGLKELPPIHFAQDVGKTDKIEIFRVTGLKELPVVKG